MYLHSHSINCRINFYLKVCIIGCFLSAEMTQNSQIGVTGHQVATQKKPLLSDLIWERSITFSSQKLEKMHVGPLAYTYIVMFLFRMIPLYELL